MPERTYTEKINTLYTTTWQARKKDVINVAFQVTPFWKLMSDKGNLQAEDGGRFIEQPLFVKKNETVKFLGKGGTVSLNDNDPMTTIYYEWKYLAGNVTRYWTDEQKNKGKKKLISMVTAKVDGLKDSIADDLEIALNAASPGSLDFHSLPQLISTTPSTGTLAGMARSKTYMQHVATSMSGYSFITYGRKYMSKMFNDCSKYGEGLKRFPTLILTDQATYELYEDEVAEIHQVYVTPGQAGTQVGDLGFGDLLFKGRPITWSPEATAGEIRFINTNFMKFTYDPAEFFDMTEWKSIPNQPKDRVAQIVLAGNLCLTAPQRQGVLYLVAE